MVYRISFTDIHGEYWDFSQKDWQVAAQSVEGMVGSFTDTATPSTVWGGQSVGPQVPEPLRGTLTLTFRVSPGESIDELWARVRRVFHPLQRGVLTVDGRRGRVSARVRIDGAIAFPVVDPTGEHYMADVKIPLVADDGVWHCAPLTGRGTIRVNNTGSVSLHVQARWSKPGVVVLPSGWRVPLPAVDGLRMVSFDPRADYVVTDIRGVEDKEATRVVVKRAVPEPVPPHSVREFRTEGDAELLWQVPVLDPLI